MKRNPLVWRRVEVPADATLGELHGILRVLMGWGDDHLHVFEVAGRHYADPFRRPEDAGDEDCLEPDEAFARAWSARRIAYTYDRAHRTFTRRRAGARTAWTCLLPSARLRS
ncbi:hypothetical protein [Kitasatospora sp. GP82]|uniref:IS1096 element passenger TnpR family protein n=1 Tax=Kitasatospora sp. GP82 TaxID=3035089 RepID=UPI0024748115|nr:hypothetical protein [Kitasatospora sp. GP82]